MLKGSGIGRRPSSGSGRGDSRKWAEAEPGLVNLLKAIHWLKIIIKVRGRRPNPVLSGVGVEVK